jgi:hypothetical protein
VEAQIFEEIDSGLIDAWFDMIEDSNGGVVNYIDCA